MRTSGFATQNETSCRETHISDQIAYVGFFLFYDRRKYKNHIYIFIYYAKISLTDYLVL